MNRSLSIACAGIALSAITACTDTESATNLHPEGPPMIEQVRMWETYSDSTGVNFNQRQVFAFGTHADATTDDQHPVTSARVLNNNMRVIMDELLVGNNLEEI